MHKCSKAEEWESFLFRRKANFGKLQALKKASLRRITASTTAIKCMAKVITLESILHHKSNHLFGGGRGGAFICRLTQHTTEGLSRTHVSTHICCWLFLYKQGSLSSEQKKSISNASAFSLTEGKTCMFGSSKKAEAKKNERKFHPFIFGTERVQELPPLNRAKQH